MKLSEDREMSLDEYCAQLPEGHRVNRELRRLIMRDYWLQCLEDAGVDNWPGMEEAIAIRNEDGEFDGRLEHE